MQGLNALEYKEHMDYDVVVSTNPAFNKAIVRINVYRHHRQVRLELQACHISCAQLLSCLRSI